MMEKMNFEEIKKGGDCLQYCGLLLFSLSE